MKIYTDLDHRMLCDILEYVGLVQAKDHGYEIPLPGQKRIHAVFSSEGLDVHQDSKNHHVMKPGPVLHYWYVIVRDKVLAMSVGGEGGI